MEGNELKIEQRLTKLETRLDEAINNHLAHLDRKVNWLIGLLISSVVIGKIDIVTVLGYFK